MQYKLSKGGEVIRTDIQVGDDTLPFFSVSLWKKQMGTLVDAGDILLLQSKQGHPFFAICFNFHNIYKINWGLRFCFIDSLSMRNFHSYLWNFVPYSDKVSMFGISDSLIS